MTELGKEEMTFWHDEVAQVHLDWAKARQRLILVRVGNISRSVKVITLLNVVNEKRESIKPHE